jgi:presenilin-like A22 family membrane protease
MIFLGSLVFFDAFLPIYLTLAFSLALPILRYFHPSVITQNLVIIISISGMSAYLGLGLSSAQVIILLVALSVYDIIAVHGTGHMVSMFKSMAKGGAIFSLIIPNDFRNINAKIENKGIELGNEFMYLGTGDIAFPLIFSASLLKEDMIASFFVIFGSFLGVNLIYAYFYITKTRKPVAALPPIAFGAILGYLLALLVL